MKIIVDKNITLYKARVKSAEEIFECIDNSREFLREWLPWVDGTKTAKDTEKYIKSLKRPRGNYQDLVFEVRYEGAIAGLLGMKDMDSLNNKAEIGYWLSKKAVGRGIMIRSCRALIDYAFTELHLNKIWIRCAVDNLSSCNIPKQLGFTYEGIERQGEFLHGRYIDIKIYSLLRKEWLKNNH
jgi:ribosomal-protein-serine acetyltransferase